jgi:hypothetical protein
MYGTIMQVGKFTKYKTYHKSAIELDKQMKEAYEIDEAIKNVIIELTVPPNRDYLTDSPIHRFKSNKQYEPRLIRIIFLFLVYPEDENIKYGIVG